MPLRPSNDVAADHRAGKPGFPPYRRPGSREAVPVYAEFFSPMPDLKLILERSGATIGLPIVQNSFGRLLDVLSNIP